MKLLTPCLYCLGAFLVWRSDAIGVSLATVQTSPTSYQWNHEQAQRMAEIARWLGAMIFAAGLTERLALARKNQTAP